MLLGRVFNPQDHEKPGMVELVEYARHQAWLRFLEELTSSIFEGEVNEFYYTIKFSDDGMSLYALVQGKKLKLDEEVLGKILNIPIIGVGTLSK